MNPWLLGYVLGFVASASYCVWSIHRTIADGVIRVEGDAGIPWQFLAGMCIAGFAAAAIWPITLSVLVMIKVLSDKEPE